MSLTVELRSNIVVFRVENDEDLFMTSALKSVSTDCALSPDKKTVVVVYNTNTEAKEAFDNVKGTVNSFKR